MPPAAFIPKNKIMERNLKKCYVFRCPRYPKCKNAAGSCCAIEWDDDGDTRIREEDCFLKGDFPLFIPKE